MVDEIKPRNEENEESDQDSESEESSILQEIQDIFTSTFEEPEDSISSDINTETKKSSISSQQKDERLQPEYDAFSLTFLEGEFEGQKVDLGVGIFEASHSQSAEWNDKSEDHIRNGASFSKIGPREFSISAEYFSLSEDVSQLVENLSHLVELQKTAETVNVSPPKLLLKQGKLKATTVVATSISSSYDYPLPKKQGFRHAKVEIQLKLIAGVGSQYATGKPLAPTPLNDYLQSISEEERVENAIEQKTKALLADCLSEEQSDKFQYLIDEGKQQNVEELLKLDAETFMQLLFSGIVSKETISESEELSEKIDEDLAKVMATKSVNVGKLDSALAESLINDSPTESIASSYSKTYEKLQPQYNQLKEAIKKQSLRPVYQGSSKTDTAKTMERLFGCGLSIRQIGGITLNASTPKAENREKLTNLNSYLAKIAKGEIDESELSDKLKISNSSVKEEILENAPYQTKEEFIENSTGLDSTQLAYQIWETFKIEFNQDS